MTFRWLSRPCASWGIARRGLAHCGVAFGALASIVLVIFAGAAPAAAENAEVAHRRSLERRNFTDAEIIVSLVRDRDLAHAIRSLYGIDRARRIQRSLEPQCLSGFRKDENSRILHSDVLIVADAGEFVFYDCIYEELLQSIGPINDDT